MRTKPDYFYSQSAVIPFRRAGDELEILLITSRKKRRWVIPKGVKEPELSAAESAAKEALEEAGILGRVYPAPVGNYQYRKWGDVCSVLVFAMLVQEVLERWDEPFRDREWLSVAEAAARTEEAALKAMILSLAETLKGEPS
jgi:phosphohistidine phosphatase